MLRFSKHSEPFFSNLLDFTRIVLHLPGFLS